MSSSHCNKDQKAPGEITGIITPFEWDEFDKVTAVKICATDDEDYLVENSEILLDMVQRFIHASGLISPPRKDPRTILVQRYTVIEK